MRKLATVVGDRKPGLLHLHDLLTLRRENDHAPARLPQLLHQFAQDKTFARARTAAKDRNAVCRTQQGFEGLALFIVELRIRRAGIRHQRETIPDALFRGLNDFPFAQQNFTQSHFAWPRFVPDIATPLGEFLEFGNRKTFTTRPAQCLLPQLTFQHDRVPVEQMFLRPLNRLTNTDALFLFRVMLRLL